MKIFYSSLILAVSLLAAPKLWAQPVTLPEGACVTPEVAQCRNDATIVKWSEGTSAWPDEACNPINSFGDCDTNSCDQANAWAQNVCAANGYEVGIWTGRKQAGCGPGGPGGPVTNGTGNISMYCQGDIPCNPLVETECDPTDQTQIEILCCDISKPIPAISEWGLIAMVAGLGLIGVFFAVRRRKAVNNS